MSKSSKNALIFAKVLGFHEIMAVGFSPILLEAIAEGRHERLFSSAVRRTSEQASFFPKEPFSHFIMAENSDWVFSGSSLAGVLCESRKMRFCLFKEGASIDYPETPS